MTNMSNRRLPKAVTLFVVEDDDGDFMAIERGLDKARIVNECVRAKNGIEALEILRGSADRTALARPYFLLCDIKMPKMNGLDLLTEIRADPDLRATPVFMLTTSRHDEDKYRAYGLNVAGYIIKGEAGRGILSLVEMLGSYIEVVDLP